MICYVVLKQISGEGLAVSRYFSFDKTSASKCKNPDDAIIHKWINILYRADKRWMSQLYSTQSTDFAGQESAVKMSEIVYHSWETNHYNKQNEPHE